MLSSVLLFVVVLSSMLQSSGGAIEEFNLNLQEQHGIWPKLAGLWIGNYSYYHGDGTPVLSSYVDPAKPYSGFPYPRDHYHGYINITISGSRFYQHNYFFNAPAPASFCSGVPAGLLNVQGVGNCGVNGIERSFEAFGTSTFNSVTGQMKALNGKGTYAAFTSVAAPMDDKTLLYTSALAGVSFHTQTNVAFPDDTHRTRTGYDYNYNAAPGDGVLQYSSLYREEKVSEAEWLEHIRWARAHYSIAPGDQIQLGQLPMQTTCLIGNHSGAATEQTCPGEKDWCEKGNDPSCAPLDVRIAVADDETAAATFEFPLAATGAEVSAAISGSKININGEDYTLMIGNTELKSTGTLLSAGFRPGSVVMIVRQQSNMGMIVAIICAVLLAVLLVLVLAFFLKYRRDEARRLRNQRAKVAAAVAKEVFAMLPHEGGSEKHTAAFKKIDADQNGVVDKGEFTTEIRRRAGEAIGDHDLELLWRSVDINGNGSVSYAEYAMFLEKAFEEAKGQASQQPAESEQTKQEP